MAVINGIFKNMRGSAGNFTFKQYPGHTVVAEKISAGKKSCTPMQMRQRIKMGNVVKMYQGISQLIDFGFEMKPVGKSNYNMFMKANMKLTDICLTHNELAEGGCIAAPYLITEGSLPSIEVTGLGDDTRTDICLGGLVIDAETKVKDFARAVVANNAYYDYGDHITFIDVLQRVGEDKQVPYCLFFATDVTLDKASEVRLLDLVSKYGFATVDGHLGHIGGEGYGVYAWVHSRKSDAKKSVGAKTLVSTQTLVNNNARMIAKYSGSMST
ncbi:MAG: hypothetical protein ACI4TU_01850 [Candidatus Cryptobacteroides sp.]